MNVMQIKPSGYKDKEKMINIDSKRWLEYYEAIRQELD